MRGFVFLGIVIGLLFGLSAGLVVAWVFWPVSYVDADPVDLRLDTKDDYQRMIAAAYMLDGDLALAWTRLNHLQLRQPAASVVSAAAREPKPAYQQALVHLALDLRQPSAVLARPTYTPRPTRTPLTANRVATAPPRATSTRAPTSAPVAETPLTEPTMAPATSVPNPDAPHFELKSKAALSCSEAAGRSHIEVQVQDKDGNPMPGIGVEVNWAAGDEVLYTGLKPEHGIGYADLTVKPGSFSVRLTDNAQSDVVKEIEIPGDVGTCSDPAATIGWRLVFARSSP